MGRIRSQEPKQKSQVPYWHSDRVPKGTSFKGWIAGPLVGINGHNIGVTKPCYAAFTNDEMKCPWCEAFGVVWHGYQPIYNMSGDAVVVGVKRDSKERLEAMDTHTPVKVSRGTEYHSAVQVVAHAWTTSKPDNRPDRKEAADISMWLFQLWKLPDLLAWHQEQDRIEAEAAKPRPKPVMVTEEEAMERTGKTLCKDMKGMLADRMKTWQVADTPPVVEPSTNGHRKRKPR